MSHQEPTVANDMSNIPHWYHPDSDVLNVTEGDGASVWDDSGNEYLDFSSQLYCVNLGHSNEHVLDAMDEQARQIPYVSSAKNAPPREELARRLAEVAPGDLSRTIFSISGSEANETALQIARAYQDAPKVLTRWRSYHGSTYGAGALTGDPETRATLERHAAVTGVEKFLPPIPRAFGTDDPEELARLAAEHLEFVIRNEGPDSIAALVSEPVAGSSGAFPAPAGYFQRVRDICDKYDILLISDEVITGFGRCGDWFGISHEGVEPDMITFAKGVTSSYAPLAGAIVNEDIADFIEQEGFDIGQTFGGHPVGCAAAVAAMDEYEDGAIENVRRLEPVFEEELAELAAKHDVVYDVRGRGFLWGIEFADPETGEFFQDSRVDDDDNPVWEVVDEAQERGVMVAGGRPSFQIIVSPPLIVTREQIEHVIDVLDESIEAVFAA